jgi:glucose-1-phosphate thymidylyltransferase
MIEGGEEFTTFSVQGWYDCGKPETLLSTNEILLQEHSSAKIYPGCIINNPVFIAESAILEHAIIGPNTTIGENAVITNAIIKDSIIGNDSHVELIILEQSIVGNNASITGTPRKINIGDYSEIRLG